MKPFKLYGDHRSGNCYKVALILSLTGRSFEWVERDVMKQSTRTPQFLAMNPNGKVPVLQLPEGQYMAESNAMLLYLAEGSSYLPTDAWERALVYQWLFFEQYSHEPYIAVARFLVKLAGREVEDAGRLKLLRKKGAGALRVMEKDLSSNLFLGGSRFSIADIALYAYTHTAEEGGIDLSPWNAVRQWLLRVESVAGFVPMAQACG
ncbi:MAG: glutathione S-transferase family protein [Xanthomonadales bacterium]